MATNRIEVELGISADVSAAKRAISNLEDSLSKLYKKQEQNGFQDLGLNEAVKTAKELEVCLSRALNQKTGKLDISAFQNGLKSAGLSMDQLNQKLLNAGSAGQQVFASLASSIAQAEIPLKRTSKLVSEFTRSIKNVFTYQISASMFQAVTGALSDAVSYTKDLNSSLNDIRIVTGQSSAQMAKFAVEANKSAQKLSTTTNNYAKASLIFYQQGLNDAEVKKRTDAVVKMANVTKESMSDVSSYMTAVWNNFDNGTESLEYYADVMTALGAATASSTKEIAAGLEKFASIGKTIGLSYEYATSAVATIVDKTRQSAETVGTGLRTIFSRLQGLSLGETLEDGVDLNKYSSALKTVGVNILDASGNMKEMDTILDSLAVKWGNLSTAQKTALAQTVGGVRQYTTLISLMDNWDSMKQNINTANTADGTLQGQQDIYAEGWEAASQRSKAALEGLYQTLLNDKGFIVLTDGLTTVTKAVTSLVSAMGGLPGILSTVGMIATKVFSKQITQGVRGATDKLTTWGSQFHNKGFWKSVGQIAKGESKSTAQVRADQAFEAQERSYSAQMADLKNRGRGRSIEYMAAEQAQTLIGRKRKFMENEGRMTEDERIRTQDRITALSEAQERRLALRQEKDQQAKEFSKLEDNAATNLLTANVSWAKLKGENAGQNRSSDEQLQRLYYLSGLQGSTSPWQVSGKASADTRRERLQGMVAKARSSAREQTLAQDFLDSGLMADETQRTSTIAKVNEAFGKTVVGEDASLEEVQAKLQQIVADAAAARAEMDKLIEVSDTDGDEQKEAKKKVKELLDKASEQGQEQASRDKEAGHVAGQIKGYEEEIDGLVNGEKKLGDKLAAGIEKATATVGGLVTGFTQAKSAMDVLGDTGASVGEQISAGMSLASGAVTAFMTGGPWAAVAYLVGVVGSIAVDALIKQFNAAEIAAQKAEAVSESLNAAADEAANRLSSLSSAVDGYEGAIEVLNSCTKGTQEWSEALKNVHSSISELLTEFPELLEYSNLFNSDGTLNQEILDEAVETAKTAAVAADAAALQGQIVAKQARLEANTVSYSRDYTGYLTKTDMQGNMYYETYNTGYKAVGNQATVKGDLEKVLNSYSTFGSEALELTDIYAALGTEMGDNSTITEEYAQSLLNLANQSVAATTMMDNAAKSIISDWATANGTDLVTGQSEFMTAAYNKAVETFSAAVKTASDQNNKANNKDYSKLGAAFDNTTFKGMSVTEAFNHARGTNYQLASNGVRGVDSNRTYVYLEGGEEKTYKIEEMQATIAAAAALEQMGAEAAKAKEKIANISENLIGPDATDEEKAKAQTQEVGLQNYLANKNLESMTESDFKTMQDTVKEMGGASAYLQQAFGMTEEEITKAFGEDFITNFENTLTRTETAWADAWGNNKDVAVEALGEVTNSMSLSNVAKLSNYMDEFSLGPAGAEAGAQFVEGLNKMIEGIDPEQQQAALTDLLTTVDWTSYDAFNQAQVILKKYGITISETDAYWKDFVADMRLAAGAMPDFSKIKTDLNSVNEIVKDLKFGDIIDEEDYQTLIAYNDEWERFFLLQADGSRQFIGNAEDFNKFIQEKTIANREEIDLRRTVSELEGIGDVKWSEGGDAAKAAFDEYMKDDSFRALMEKMGYTSDMISSMTAEQLTEMYTRVGEAVNANQIELDQSEFEQMIASMATSFTDLNTLYTDGTIGVDAYSRALLSMASGYEYCTSAVEAYQKAVASGVGVDEAREALEKAVAVEQEAEKYESAYSNALSGRNSMSVTDLNALEEADPDLYYQYLTATEDEWYEASYEAYMSWLDTRMAGYATDSAEYKALMMEKRQAEEDFYAESREKAQKAQQEQDAIWEEDSNASSSALSIISENLTSADALTFENINELEHMLTKAGVSAERIKQILTDVQGGDSTEAIRAKTVAAMEAAFLGLATENEKAKEYNGLITIGEVDISDFVKQEIDDTANPNGTITFDANTETPDAYITGISQGTTPHGIIFNTADGGTFEADLESITTNPGSKDIIFRSKNGISFKTTISKIITNPENKTITFVGTEGSTYTALYDEATIDTHTKTILFTGKEGLAYKFMYTKATIGQNKVITFTGEDGNYTTQYNSIVVDGTDGNKTILINLTDANGQGQTLQAQLDSITLNDKTVTLTGEFGKLEEELASFGVKTNQDGSVDMNLVTEEGTEIAADLQGITLKGGNIEFTTNLGTIKDDAATLTSTLESLPEDYPIQVTLTDGTTQTLTAKELKALMDKNGGNVNAVVNYLEGSGGDLVKDREINVTVNYKAQRAAALREVFLGQAGDKFLSTFDSGDFLGRVKTGHTQDGVDRGTSTQFGKWWIEDTNKQKGTKKQEAIAGTALQIEAGAIEAIESGDIEGLQALQDFIDGVNQVDPAVGAQLQLMLDSVVEADESIARTKNENGEYVYALATQPSTETTQPVEGTTGSGTPVRTIETVTDQDALNGAAGATYTQATLAFEAYDWHGIGENVVEGITTGISDGIANFTPPSFAPMAGAVYEQAAGDHGVESPSKMMKPIGKYVVEGIEVGIEEGVTSSDGGDFTSMADKSLSNAQDAFGVHSPSVDFMPVGFDSVAGVEVGLDAGAAAAAGGSNWESYAARTLANADKAFGTKDTVGLGAKVSNSFTSDWAAWSADPTHVVNFNSQTRQWEYDTDNTLGLTMQGSAQGAEWLRWYNEVGQYDNFDAYKAAREKNKGKETWLASQNFEEGTDLDAAWLAHLEERWNQAIPDFTNLAAMTEDYVTNYWKTIGENTSEYSEYQRGILSKYVDEALAAGKTGDEITAYVQEKIDADGLAIKFAVGDAWAQIKDIMASGVAAIVQGEQAAAKATYDAWVSAFKAISAARLELMGDNEGSLLTSMKDDVDDLNNLYMALLDQGYTMSQIWEIMTATGDTKQSKSSLLKYGTPDYMSYRESGNVAHLDWSGPANNGYGGLTDTTVDEYFANVTKAYFGPGGTATSEMNEILFGEKGLINQGLIGRYNTGTASEAEIKALDSYMATGLITVGKDGKYQQGNANKFLSDPDMVKQVLGQILGIDPSLLSYTKDSDSGNITISVTDRDKAETWVQGVQSGAMADMSALTAQMAAEVTKVNKVAIDEKAKELELLEKARDNGIESLDEAEKAQLRSYLGLAENADLSSVSLDTLTGAAADAAAALGLLSKSAQTDEYMALKGYTKDQSGNYVLDTTGANTTDTSDDSDMVESMLASGYKYFEGTDGQSYYAKTDSAGNVIDGSQIQVVITPEAAAVMAAGYQTGDTTIDDAASGKTGTQVDADNRLALAKNAGFSSFQEQDDYIKAMESAGNDTTNFSDGGMLDAAEIIAAHKEAGIELTNEEALEIQREYANQLALMEEGLSELAESGKDWLKTLKDENKSLKEQSKILPQLRKSYQKILGLTDEQMAQMPDDFFLNPDNLELATTAAEEAGEKGQEALDKLQVSAADAITPFKDLEEIVGNTGKTFNELATELSQLDLNAGDLLSGNDLASAEAYWDGVVNASIAGGQSVAEAVETANAAMANLGYDVEPGFEYVTETFPAGTSVEHILSKTGTESFDILNADGTTTTVTGDEFKSEAVNGGTTADMTIGYLKGKGTSGGVGTGGTSNNYRKKAEKTGGGGGNGGGGGGARRRYLAKAKPADYKERYHEINNALDEVTDALERLNKQQDRAWGAERLKSMQAESEELKKQRDLIRKKTEEAQNYLKQDLADAAQYGWTFDEENNVSNYEDNWNKLLDVYNAKIAEYNAMSAEQQEALEKDVTEANENGKTEYINPDTGVAFGSYEEYLKYHYLDEPTAALEQVEETMDELEQLGIDYDDVLNALYDNFIEQVQTKWDTANEIADANIEYLEHKISRLEDNAYKAAETIGLMSDKMDYTQDKFNAATTALDDLLKGYDSAWSAEAIMAGQLTAEDLAGAGMDANAVEMVQSIMSELMNLEQEMTDTLIESFESMTEAFDEFNEDLDRYISTIEHAQSITSTYRNIIDLTGKSMSGFSTELLKAFNNATIDQAKANMKSNKTKYDTIQAEYNETYEQYLNAQALHAQGKLNDAALQVAKKAFEATQDNLNEAQEAYVASWEAALQAVADSYTSTMEGVMDEISKNLANGLAGGIDALQERMDRMKTKDSNYVDDYEKIYQLTKLTRDLETQIDNTSNVRAQKELLKFQKEINGILQSDKKLSEYDIDYLQKKYDLKLAEIALEDAQNAKSQVTMRRDSEGNYNYVYTADENAVADAEAEYATKLYEMQKANDEYITSLSDSIVSLEAEMKDALLALDPTQFASEEEFNAAVEEIIAFYTEQMSYHQEQLETVLGNNKDLYEKDMVWYNKYANYKMADAASFIDSWNETLLAQATGFETIDDLFGTFFSQAETAQSESVTAYRNYVDAINTINAEAGHPTETLAQSLTEDIEEMTDQAEQAATDMGKHAETIVGEITSIGQAIETMADKFGVEIVNMAKQTDLLVAALTDMLEIMGKAGDIELEEGLLADIEARRQAREQEYASQSFDTGGYTGAWGPEGKLAWLHQKELVLNAADTENILASVGILRQIANTIDLNALTSAGGFISLMSSGISGNRETLQQEVHIEASFPAVTDKNQIEDAFTDLVNLAAQYANRK